MNELSLVLSGTALLFSFLTAGFSIYAFAYMVGVKKSTHQVQMMPVSDIDNTNPTGMDLAKQFAGLEDLDKEHV